MTSSSLESEVCWLDATGQAKPFRGVPMLIKDLRCEVAGCRYTVGIGAAPWLARRLRDVARAGEVAP